MILILIISIMSISTYKITFSTGTIEIDYLDETNFKVTMTYKLKSWIGLGFGTSMTNTDMHIATFTDASNYVLQDTYSTGRTFPQDDTKRGTTNDLKNMDYKVDANGNGVLTYTRVLTTTDTNDKSVTLNADNDYIIAWGDNALGYHGGNIAGGKFKISKTEIPGGNTNTNTTDTTIPPTYDLTDKFNFFTFHGIILIIVWTGFNSAGYIFARFYKHLPFWIWVHRIGSGTTALISIGVSAAAISKTSIEESTPTASRLHMILGIIVFAFICLQTVLGVLDYYLIYEKRVESNGIHKFKVIHRIIGISLTVIVYILLITGFMAKYWDDLIAIPAVLCGVFLLTILIMEINFCVSNSSRGNKIHGLFLSKNSSILPTKTLHEINSEKDTKKFVLYENYIIDVKDYPHPGGKNLLEENMHSDIGRYVTGTQGYSRYVPAYFHNLSTHEYIVNKLSYAHIYDPNMNSPITKLSSNNNLESQVGMKAAGGYLLEESNVQLKKVTEISENIHEYQFEIGSVHNSYVFSRFLTDVNWMGRHFSVTSTRLNKTRYYSLSLTLHPEMKQKHLDLIRNVERMSNNQQTVDTSLKDNEKHSNYLCLYIKNYKYSNCLSANIDTDLKIRGPSGVGLNLYENRLDGTHVIFAAGTGIIPFIDLVSFTARYIVQRINLSNFNSNANSILPEENFNNIVSNNFQLHLYAGFANKKSALFLEVLEELFELDKKYNLNVFKLHIRYGTEDRWDDKFMTNKLGILKNLITKAYIVGPVPFMEDIKKSLLIADITSEEKIFLV